ncbi:MAG: carboxypeptidase-like regulatory domain-containing protein, partial [Janthinobacterium lividum]
MVSQNGGSVQGTITDQSDARVAIAEVVVTSKETGETRTMRTGATGLYAIGPLDPGNYTLRITAPGFESLLVDTV